jgi:hypothetical protein
MRTASIIKVINAFAIDAVRISETSVYSHETTWRYIPDSYYINTLR